MSHKLSRSLKIKAVQGVPQHADDGDVCHRRAVFEEQHDIAQTPPIVKNQSSARRTAESKAKA